MPTTGCFDYLYLTMMALILFKVIKWLLAYVNNLKVINKMEGMPILPFIGNMHQIKFNRDGKPPFKDKQELQFEKKTSN